MLLVRFLTTAVTILSSVLSDSDDIYRSKTSDDFVPCDSGWYHFRNKCYKVVPRRRPATKYTWTEALSLCKGYGGDLVSINSQEEQDFIIAYLQMDVGADWTLWIGLNDRDKEGDFSWTDGSVFNYSNFYGKEPSGSAPDGTDEDCVQMVFEPPDAVGQWNDLACNLHKKCATCKKNANFRKRSPNLIYCSPEEGGGWRYQSSCYHIVTESESWRNAERLCRSNFKGHLLTIREQLEDLFLELALPDLEKETWIGIKLKDQLQQKWTSGWYVSYERFNKEEKFVEGTCVARKNRKEWIIVPCSRQLPFICEVSKATPPILKPAPIGSYCPKDFDEWRDLGGDYCYYIETEKHYDFNEANFDCLSRGGHLVSIHSQEESDILHPFVIYKGYNILIGLIRQKANNEEVFGWTDGSELNYQNWGPQDPNRLDEKCVDVLAATMEWRDNDCNIKYSGYICSVKKIVRTSSLVEGASYCENFCIAPETYLHGIISQCPEAIRTS